MSTRLHASRPRVVLFEGRGSLPLPDAHRVDLLQGLLEDGHAVTRVSGNGPVSPPDDSEHLVLARFESPPQGPAGPNLRLIDIDGQDAGAVRSAVRNALTGGVAAPPAAWKPWFPVIDYDRCTNCMQCLTFCLFDVYGVEREKISVQNPEKCKTECPACSRVCPEAAIMFPKYKAGPINGDRVRDEDLRREAMKVDISALLGGDLHAALRSRSAQARTRFSTERDESKALLERKRCLKELKEALDIPDEVLMTLPSAGDIEERTRRAREKSARRQERSQSITDRRPATPEDWGI